MVVVVGGNFLHHVEREGELSGRGNMSERENVLQLLSQQRIVKTVIEKTRVQ